MLHDNPNAFCQNPLDRAGVRRKDEAWVESQRRRPGARLMLVYRGEVLTERRPADSVIQWLGMDALRALPVSRELVFLGLWKGEPVFAVDASGAPDAPLSDIGTYASLRAAGPYLPAEELSIAGQAVWLLNWNLRNIHCTQDGDRTEPREGGFKRVNLRTGTEHFPRTDPVAIVLPYRGEEVCLGRGPHFPPGFMSAFAGYLEPGETLEQCGARELYEEAGLTVSKIAYRYSQPWPFPSSLMMGFLAEVEGKELTIDPTEIEEARWFTREEVAAILDGRHEIMAPPPMAIAHHLMKDWVAGVRA
ncbi:NAD(+) diphosphatase [Parvularcula maris]|uniref:NAD(+) diphosphatase n=1 Tax=Parvularcula maris TaxID=2965077 RepID=A0A9X2L6B7_9PROT|nr:NAD(+) diphosphatase [Parvularcula maris]MCQ8183860.1 NAD(+) diphosphatase [Parvularcula maris]